MFDYDLWPASAAEFWASLSLLNYDLKECVPLSLWFNKASGVSSVGPKALYLS